MLFAPPHAIRGGAVATREWAILLRDPVSDLQKTVLIVEDNDDNRLIYSQYLSYAGYRILEAGNGLDGIELVRRERPDLVLMDISMPQMDGLTATRRLKADPTVAEIPIIALTAHAMPADADMARAAGCDGYIAKPVMPREVRSEVERWIGPAAREAPPSA